jgi:FkbM family methyltransferase
MKHTIKRLAQKCGFDIKVFHDPMRDIAEILRESHNPVLFDVGANIGQTARTLNDCISGCRIFSFEPSPETAVRLRDNTKHLPNVSVIEAGLGSENAKLKLNENRYPDMSSFLDLAEAGWGQIIKTSEVQIRTVDGFCEEETLSRVELLKIDTQGFDFEVLKGSERMLREQRIGLVFLELCFAPLYENQATLGEVSSWLEKFGYHALAIYDINFMRRRILGWANFLFGTAEMKERLMNLQ